MCSLELRKDHGGWSLAYKKQGTKGLHAWEPHRAPLAFTPIVNFSASWHIWSHQGDYELLGAESSLSFSLPLAQFSIASPLPNPNVTT